MDCLRAFAGYLAQRQLHMKKTDKKGEPRFAFFLLVPVNFVRQSQCAT
jgi:hypothetical protein